MRRRDTKFGFGVLAGLALLAACSGDGGYSSPTAPPPPSPPPTSSEAVAYQGEATDPRGQTYSRPWSVTISEHVIVLDLDWGERTEHFEGQIAGTSFSAVAFPPYLDPQDEVTEERLSGSFSDDFASFEATMTSIVGAPEVSRWETRWRAWRVGPGPSGCQPPPLPTSSDDATPGTYTRVTPQCPGVDTLVERVVFESDGTFRIETESGNHGRFSDPGKYARAGSLYALQFERWYTAGSLTAEAAFRGRCVVVDYNGLLEIGDYTDGEYCR